MNYPKIGIRPVIDGRWGGVRESLEAKTMGMAKSAAELISSTLRYPDGKPVECVIANSTIGGGAEAARCAEQFSRENVVATLSVTPCWCYGSETFDMDIPSTSGASNWVRFSPSRSSRRSRAIRMHSLPRIPRLADSSSSIAQIGREPCHAAMQVSR